VLCAVLDAAVALLPPLGAAVALLPPPGAAGLRTVGAAAALDEAADALAPSLDVPVLPAGAVPWYCGENGLRYALPSGALDDADDAGGATDVPPNPRNRDKLKPPPLDGAVFGGGGVVGGG